MSDLMAVGAIRAIQDHGLRVPQDIAVAGYDGIALGRYTVPRLTTIRQNTAVLAERAADILLRCIEENAPARHETVPFELVEGESV
jgi:transcriptional regulator, lacI family